VARIAANYGTGPIIFRPRPRIKWPHGRGRMRVSESRRPSTIIVAWVFNTHPDHPIPCAPFVTESNFDASARKKVCARRSHRASGLALLHEVAPEAGWFVTTTISRGSSLVPQTSQLENSGMAGNLPKYNRRHNYHLRHVSVTLGPWSDFIKEFGFVLPKPSKRIQSVTKMQMWAHESRSAPFGGAT
jgi:hypothetical protein